MHVARYTTDKGAHWFFCLGSLQMLAKTTIIQMFFERVTKFAQLGSQTRGGETPHQIVGY